MKPPEDSMLGVVLAGGDSRRLGRDKALLLVDGEPLWQRQMKVLRATGADDVVLIRRPGQAAPPGVVCWRDHVADTGPLGGLHAALAPQSAALVAVLAVDMPGIDEAWFRWLRGFCRDGTGAMARHTDACEPLAAIYPARAIREIEARLAARDHSLQRLALALEAAGCLKLIPLPAEKHSCVASLNTPENLARWNAG